MKVIPGQTYGVVTGDIVGSSQLSAPERESLVSELNRASAALQKAFPEDVPLPVGIFRGDGWQFLVSPPERTLRMALFLRAWLIAHAPEGRKIDTRLAVAWGTLTFVPDGNVLAGDGDAYRASGHALDALKEPQRLALVLLPQEAVLAGALAAFAPVLDAVVQSWTGRQARAILGRLQGFTQEAIAEAWPEEVTRQAIAGHLERAQWGALEGFLEWLEGNFKGLLLLNAT